MRTHCQADQSSKTHKWRWTAWEDFGRDQHSARGWGCRENTWRSAYRYATRAAAEKACAEFLQPDMKTNAPALSAAAATLGSLGGKSRSKAKAAASRRNGRLGGRPRKKKSAPEPEN
jgi:hypothetical protein